MVSGYPQNLTEKLVDTSDVFLVPDIPDNLTSIVTETADKGLSIFNQIYDAVNNLFDGVTGFGKKMEDVSFNIYNSVAGAPGKNGDGEPESDVEVEDIIVNLLHEADKEWEDGDYGRSKNEHPVERDVRKGIQAGRKNVLNFIKLFAEKADEVKPAISQGVVDLAEETKDLQKKSKPLVDAIVKVNEVIESPEFRSFMDEIEGLGKSLSNVFGEKCKWSYAKEKFVAIGKFEYVSYGSNKVWMDREYIDCRLRQNGYNKYDEKLVRELADRMGTDYEKVRYFLIYQLNNPNHIINL